MRHIKNMKEEDVNVSGNYNNIIKCLQYYSNAISSLAMDIENNFTKRPLMLTIFFKETKLIPRLRLHEIAANRYRLRRILSDNKHETKFDTNYDGEKKEDGIDLDNPEIVQNYCFYLKKIANSKGSTIDGSNASSIIKKIDCLRSTLAPWRYKEDLTN